MCGLCLLTLPPEEKKATKLWVVWYGYRKCEEPDVGGVYSSREEALKEVAPDSWPDEFSYPEHNTWGTTEKTCYLKEFTLDAQEKR